MREAFVLPERATNGTLGGRHQAVSAGAIALQQFGGEREILCWCRQGRCTVTDSDRADAIAALKRVRARLESALRNDVEGRPPAASGSEAKMASGPMYQVVDARGRSDRSPERRRGYSTRANGVDRRAEDATPPDDLTSIRGIDAGLAQHLASLGVTRFADIAAWRSDDVHNVSQALGISREISRQNWIEQAALLERRKAKSEIEAAAPAREHVPGLRPELQEIVKAARKDAPAHDDAPSPLALELASQTLGERADATVTAAPPAVEERVAPQQSASGAERGALKFSPQPGPRYPSSRFPRQRMRMQPSVRGGSRMPGSGWPRALNSPTASACTMSTKQR